MTSIKKSASRSQRQASAEATTPVHVAGVGAIPRNTAPAICTVLRHGVDSLYLSVPGVLSEEGAARLDEARKAARSDQEHEHPLALVSLLDHQFTASASGGKLYRYCLADHCYRIQVKGPKSRHLPLAYAKIDSTFLASVGVEQAVNQLRLILSAFGVPDMVANVSRIDLFADFVGGLDPAALTEAAWVTRAKTKTQHWKSGRCSGWSLGEGKLMARLYDKTLEIQTSGKLYLVDLWKRAGWDGQAPVYRLELQYRNDALRELKSNHYPAILDSLGGLWRYALTDWLRLTIPNLDDRTRSRWETHPVWSHLRDEVPWKDNGHAERGVMMLERAPPDLKLYQYFFASLTSYMAAKGLTDPLEAARRLYGETEAHYERFAEHRGEGFYGQATTRAAKKAMQYHLPFPAMVAAAQARQDAAVAEAYRKASGR